MIRRNTGEECGGLPLVSFRAVKGVPLCSFSYIFEHLSFQGLILLEIDLSIVLIEGDNGRLWSFKPPE